MLALTSPKARSKHDVSFIRPRATSVVCVYCKTSNISRNTCMMGERKNVVFNIQKERSHLPKAQRNLNIPP